MLFYKNANFMIRLIIKKTPKPGSNFFLSHPTSRSHVCS
jgi:hypothetical protein